MKGIFVIHRVIKRETERKNRDNEEERERDKGKREDKTEK